MAFEIVLLKTLEQKVCAELRNKRGNKNNNYKYSLLFTRKTIEINYKNKRCTKCALSHNAIIFFKATFGWKLKTVSRDSVLF